MKKSGLILFLSIFFIYGHILTGSAAASGDSCMFEMTAADLPPNIVLFIDNGVEMQHAAWHPDYDNSVDYTPAAGGFATNGVDDDGDGDIDEDDEDDVLKTNGTGSGFFHENGYMMDIAGGKWSIVAIKDDLEIDLGIPNLEETGGRGSHIWTINSETVNLPAEASVTEDVFGIIDKAGNFRYSKNYLNWLFFYATAVDLDGDGTVEPVYAGTPLPDKSRFYHAKKALLAVGKETSNKALFAIYNFSNDEGSSNVQPIGMVVESLSTMPVDNVLDSNYVNNINNMGTVTYSPLAEGLAQIGGDIGSPAFGTVDATNYCQKTFVIVVSTGLSSQDTTGAAQYMPTTLEDFDGDGTDGEGSNGPGQGTLTVDGTTHTIMTLFNGSTYLDDIAHYFYTHDMMVANDNSGAFQNVITYTVGFMTSPETRLFLINTANNGNGHPNLTDSSDPDYAKYHFDARSSDDLSQAILDAVSDIISRTSSFAAPVVPVTRTTSGNSVYMAFFKPMEGNFWEGNVVKFGLSPQNEVVDVNGDPATWPNGAIKENAEPFWASIDWAVTSKSNGIDNPSRNIYTYLGADPDLTNPVNEFAAANTDLTAAILDNPADVTVNGTTVGGRDKVIGYIRGADVYDQDDDGNTTENRWVITGDIRHSEPLVVNYYYTDNSATTMVYFGSNDGMLHAILDITDDNVNADGDETTYGTEAWAFIPPGQLSRLKHILEGTAHIDFVDASPKVYFHDVNTDGLIDPAAGDRMILVCGERKGGTTYFALDVTDPAAPEYLWGIRGTSKAGTLTLSNIERFNADTFKDADTLRLWDGAGQWHDVAVVAGPESGSVTITYDAALHDLAVGDWVGNITNDEYADVLANKTNVYAVWGLITSITDAGPYTVVPELAESWSEPQFGVVKTSGADTAGTAVFFIGGGYSPDNSDGKAVVAFNLFSGAVVKKFTAINFSVPSTVRIIDEDNNGFVDKIYVGDLGGQMWRIGQFSVDTAGNPLSFPASDENINTWTEQVFFRAPTYVVDSTTYTRKFMYPPSITFEKEFDMVFMGSGDREDACSTTTGADRIYAVKDTHVSTTLTEANLVDVTDTAATPPNLNDATGDVDSNGEYDQGWYIRLVDAFGSAAGEKVLSRGTVFYKTFYITTFTPNDDPCVPGGSGLLYALNYLTGEAVLTFGNDADGDGVEDLTRAVEIGGGIPSKPVMVLTRGGEKLLISVGTTNVDGESQSIGAGIISIDPLAPLRNFFYIWWMELFS